MGSDDDENAALKRRLKAVAQRPENQRCCDCRDMKPTWASLLVPPSGAPEDAQTLGAFCCFHCSGAHRRLGVHICFVRSLTLDDWSEKEVVAMEVGGNKIVNDAYEAQIGNFTFVKLNPESDLEARDTFIKAKYREHTFLDPTKFVAGNPAAARNNSTKLSHDQLKAMYRSEGGFQEDFFSESKREKFEESNNNKNDGPQLLDPHQFAPTTARNDVFTSKDDIFKSVDIDVLESKDKLPPFDDNDSGNNIIMENAFSPFGADDRNPFPSFDANDVEFVQLKGGDDDDDKKKTANKSNTQSSSSDSYRRSSRRPSVSDRSSNSRDRSRSKSRPRRHQSSKSPVPQRDEAGRHSRRRSKSQGPDSVREDGRSRRRNQSGKSPDTTAGSEHTSRTDRRSRRHTKSPAPGSSSTRQKDDGTRGGFRRVQSDDNVALAGSKGGATTSDGARRRQSTRSSDDPLSLDSKSDHIPSRRRRSARQTSREDDKSSRKENHNSRIDDDHTMAGVKSESGMSTRRPRTVRSTDLDSKSDHGPRRRRQARSLFPSNSAHESKDDDSDDDDNEEPAKEKNTAGRSREDDRSSRKENHNNRNEDDSATTGAKGESGTPARRPRSGRSTDLDAKSDHGPSIRRRRQGKSLLPSNSSHEDDDINDDDDDNNNNNAEPAKETNTAGRRRGSSRPGDSLSKSEHGGTRRPRRTPRSPTRRNGAEKSKSSVVGKNSPTRKPSSNRKVSPKPNNLPRIRSASDMDSSPRRSPTFVHSYKKPELLPCAPMLDEFAKQVV